jgi:hypothetical protein
MAGWLADTSFSQIAVCRPEMSPSTSVGLLRSYNCDMNLLAVMAVWLACAPAIVAAEQSDPTDQSALIDGLIQALHREPWPGAMSMCSPLCWNFHFTAPMQRLLELGRAVKGPLLRKISDVAIRDQVIILLGGVGDERSVGPIIAAMKAASSEPSIAQRERTLTAGNLALTNITVAEVVWHHGGGIPFDACPKDPAGCWSTWWEANRATFRVRDIKTSRRYVNYPNYGIYRGLP